MTVPEVRVLVLDDEYAVRASLIQFLTNRGMEVFDFETAEEALEGLMDKHIDVCVVDIRLPGMDGDSFVEQAHSTNPELKYVIHTGSSAFKLSDKLQEIGLGKEDVFMKPVLDMNDIYLAIMRLIKLEN